MFARLRFDRVIGRDHKQSDIDSRCACQHITNKPLMPRDINDSQAIFTQLQLGKSQIDRNATFFFFR